MRITIPTILVATAALLVPTPSAAQDAAAVADGARVWSSNCTRCHNARPSQERTDGQWLTIMLHMRARANLTKTDAGLVTAFMQATNLAETTTAVVSPEAATTGEEDAGAASESSPELTALIRYLRLLSIP